MTQKEKAEELVDKFYQTTPNEAWYNPPLGIINIEYKAWEQSKQCALIAVDEIIEVLDKMEWTFTDKKADYFREVKQEIEKL